MKPYKAKRSSNSMKPNAGDSGYKPQLPPRPGKKGKAPGGKKDGGKIAEYDLTAPLTGKNLKRETNAYLRLQTRPLARQLNSEQQASRFRETQEIPAWYQGYQADLARLRGESQAAYGQAANTVSQFAQQGGAQDAANRGAVAQRAMQDAQMRGVAYDPSAETGQVEAEAARNNSTGSILGAIAGQGANQFSYLSNRQGIAGQASIEARQQEGMRRRSITADQRELAAKKGDLGTQFRGDQRELERKYLLEKKAVGLDKYKANLSASTSTANSQRSQDGQNKRQEDAQRDDKGNEQKDDQQARKKERRDAQRDKAKAKAEAKKKK